MSATAYHEAGHIVAKLHFGFPIVRATVEASGDYHGAVEGPNIHIELAETSDDSCEIETAQRNFLVICFAGPEAQRAYDPDSVEPWHAAGDEESAVDALWHMGYHPDKLAAIDAELRLAAKEFVRTHWSQIDAVAKALLEKREMTGEELRRVLEAAA
jgi:hypothetical protein